MKHHTFIFIIVALLQFNACGQKKVKDEEKPKNSSDDTSGNQGPQGPKGPQGPQGPQGPGNPFAFEVLDAQNFVIGKTTWESATQFHNGNTFLVLLSDGTTFAVNPYNGFYGGGAYCFYASTDCSGTCLFPAAPGAHDNLIQGLGGFLKLTTAQARTQRSYASYATESVDGRARCITRNTPATEWLVDVTTPWALPTGLVYPIPVPLNVRQIAQ